MKIVEYEQGEASSRLENIEDELKREREEVIKDEAKVELTPRKYVAIKKKGCVKKSKKKH